jgi:hypothetical protein
MRYTANTLLSLLPATNALRDAAAGGALRDVLDVIATEIAVLEENLDQLYDDQFIETCADWVVPYIGGLIGYTELHGDVPRISSPRAEVANTIALRRRKGTPGALEQVAHDVSGCSVHVVEYFQRLGATQYMNHVRPGVWFAPDLRQWEPLERTDSAFDTVQHTVDVRAIESGDGLYNIPNIGVWLWRLTAYPRTQTMPVRVDNRRYLFDPLGRDTQLFTNAVDERGIAQLSGPLNVPEPISRRRLDAYLADYYGPDDDKSVCLYIADTPIPIIEIIAADLSDAPGGQWAHQPADVYAIDPVLGRIAFPTNKPPPNPDRVSVTFMAGFSSDMGGGEYERAPSFAVVDEPAAEVELQNKLQTALNHANSGGAVQIQNSRRYALAPKIAANAGASVELRAANGRRPVLALSGEFVIEGADQSVVTLNGLVIEGSAIRVPASAANVLRTLRLRHCTLVPGRALEIDGTPKFPGAPSLIVERSGVTVEIDHCITGPLHIHALSTVAISNSIVDATAEDLVAYAGPDGDAAGATLQMVDSTVIGKMRTVLADYVSNAIVLAQSEAGDAWDAPVWSERRQSGCVRFSWAPPEAALPRRYHCQPEHEIDQRVEAVDQAQSARISAADRARIEADVRTWLKPRFVSMRYGDPGYGQLHRRVPAQIYEGADDESEMGAFHELRQPQRDSNVRRRTDEYLRFGLEAGVCFAT